MSQSPVCLPFGNQVILVGSIIMVYIFYKNFNVYLYNIYYFVLQLWCWVLFCAILHSIV